ncbi:MAG TPA: hypothetical protein VLJ57_12035 [Burkholderiaceae bacterium]|nr:hypothetical protein [Burkholderiaceae bacterium]
MAADLQFPLTPHERLAQSRRAIVRHLHHDDGRGAQADEDSSSQSDDAMRSDRGFASRDGGWWHIARRAGRSWWRHHPAHAATEVAVPVIKAFAREKPLQVLGIAAGVGAVAVLIRPWRMLWFTRMVAGALGSAELSGVVLSLLNGGSKKDMR